MKTIRNYIALEREVLMGDNAPTYFIDLVTVLPDGRKSHGNIRSSKNITEARSIARKEANSVGTEVVDETIIQECKEYAIGSFK